MFNFLVFKIITEITPEIIATFSDQIVRPDQFISFKCAATGSPPPQVTTELFIIWYRIEIVENRITVTTSLWELWISKNEKKEEIILVANYTNNKTEFLSFMQTKFSIVISKMTITQVVDSVNLMPETMNFEWTKRYKKRERVKRKCEMCRRLNYVSVSICMH